MIELVMNAFPRTGSTILWRMVKEARPDALHLYEPLHDKLFILLDDEGDKSSVLHGVPLWQDYFKVDRKTVHEMRLKHRDCTNLLRLQDIQRYLDVVDAIPERLILQPNRMHFILRDLAQRYDCKVLHLTRGPADCFLGFVEIFEMFGSALTKDYNWWIDNICGFVTFFKNQYESMVMKFNAPLVTGFLDKWVVVWAYQNYYAVDQADGKDVMAVSLEDITDGAGVQKIEDFTGLKLKTDIIDKKRVYLADDAFKEIVDERINSLGLTYLADEISKATPFK